MVVCLENVPTERVLPLIAGLSEGRVFLAPLGVDPRAELPTATSAAKRYLPMIDVYELNVIGAEHRTHPQAQLRRRLRRSRVVRGTDALFVNAWAVRGPDLA